MALAGNPRIAAALALVRVREQEAEVAASPGRPAGTLLLLAPPPSVFQTTFNNDYVLSPARLEFRQLLLDGGKLLARLDQAHTQATKAAQEAVSEEQQLCLEVQLAYLQSLSAGERLALAEESLEAARRHQTNARARYAAGQAPRGDILTANVPVSERELELSRARFQARDAQESLARLLGLPLDTPLELVEPAVPAPLEQSLEQLLPGALADRPSLKAVRLELAAAEQGIKAASRENNAELQAILGAAVQSNNQQFLDGVGLRAGLQLSWPFLDGNRTSHLTLAAVASRDLAAARLAEAERQVEQEVRRAYRAVELAQTSYATAGQRLTAGEEAVRVAAAQYEAGFVAFHAVRDAQLDLDRARVDLMTLYYDYLQARAQLDWACGREALEE